jgi:hypothetical protein
MDKDWHDHKPMEACKSDCPEPHMNKQEAEDWWERLNSATRLETYWQIMYEAGKLPGFMRKIL